MKSWFCTFDVCTQISGPPATRRKSCPVGTGTNIECTQWAAETVQLQRNLFLLANKIRYFLENFHSLLYHRFTDSEKLETAASPTLVYASEIQRWKEFHVVSRKLYEFSRVLATCQHFDHALRVFNCSRNVIEMWLVRNINRDALSCIFDRTPTV